MKKIDKKNYNLKIVKTDCFAYNKDEKLNCNKCTILNDLYCGFKKCNFFKTVEEDKLQRMKFTYQIREE